MSDPKVIHTTMAVGMYHKDDSDEECCGCLNLEMQDDGSWKLICNECGEWLGDGRENWDRTPESSTKAMT